MNGDAKIGLAFLIGAVLALILAWFSRGLPESYVFEDRHPALFWTAPQSCMFLAAILTIAGGVLLHRGCASP